MNMSVSVITQEEIRHSKARNIGELLENVAGVRIMNDGSQGMKRVQIRGEDAFRTVVMIDGQRISEHKSMSGAPMLIDPSMVERIEVIKGPASVLYGSDAIGGAINIITKKGGKEKFGAEVSTGFNSSAQGKSAAASIYGTLDKLEYRLSAALEDNEELKTPVGEVPYTSFSSKTASLYLAYNLTEDTKIGLTADTYELDFMSGVQDASYEDFFVDVPKWKRTKGAVFVESKNLTDNLVRLRADAFYQQNKKDMHNRVYIYQKPSPIMPFPVVDMKMDNFAENELRQTGVSLQTDWMIGERHYLIAGYEFLYDDMTTAKSMYRSLRSVISLSSSFSAVNRVMRVKSRSESISSGELCGPARSAMWLSRVRCSEELMAALMRLCQCSRTASSSMEGMPWSSVVSSTSWAMDVFSTSCRIASSANSLRLP